MEKQKRIAILQATENWTGGAGNKARSQYHDTNNHYDQELMIIINCSDTYAPIGELWARLLLGGPDRHQTG